MRIALLNTTIATSEGSYTLRRITAEEARAMIPNLTSSHVSDRPAEEYVVSAIGHESTAQAMGALLGLEVSANRIQFQQEAGQRAICLRVRGRIQEGQILDLEALEAIGYDLYELSRLAEIQVGEPADLANLLGDYATLGTFPQTYHGMVEALRLAQSVGSDGRVGFVSPRDGMPKLFFDCSTALSFGGWSPAIELPAAKIDTRTELIGLRPDLPPEPTGNPPGSIGGTE